MDNLKKRAGGLLEKMTEDELSLLVQVMEGLDGLNGTGTCSSKSKKGSKVAYLAGSVALGALSFRYISVIQKKLENRIFRQMKKK